VKDEIQPGREEEFQRAHAHHFLRRSKLADLPGCPPQVHRVVTCPMTKAQEAQYREFEREAEIRINGTRVSGHGILAEWSRLRSFANARARVTPNRKLAATPDSGKLPRLLDVLAEVGIRKSQPEPGSRAIVGTMDRSFARITAAFLEEHGIKTGLLVGGVEVAPITRRFRSNDPAPFVIVMTIQKGGVSLNLQEARAAVALDESWNPDDMVQFFDRGDRGSRTTPLLCVTMRTRSTIQEYIAEVAGGKEINNKNAYQFLSALRARSTRAGQ
jgi:SNF2 family DNA or RNA helicase